MKPHQKLNAWVNSFKFVKTLYETTNTFLPKKNLD